MKKWLRACVHFKVGGIEFPPIYLYQDVLLTIMWSVSNYCVEMIDSIEHHRLSQEFNRPYNNNSVGVNIL